MAAGVSPPGGVDPRKRRLAARRTSAGPVGSLGSAKDPKSSPAARPADPRVHSARERDAVRDRGTAKEPCGDVVAPGRLEDPDLRRVGNEERRVVRLAVRGVRDATLPARFEE